MSDKSSRTFFITLVILFSAHVFSSFASAAQINLAWDPESGVTGYKVYYGTASEVYGSPIDVGNVTTYALTVTPGQTYFIAATAYNQFGESGYSGELNAVSLTTSVNPAGAGTVNPSGTTWYNSGQGVPVSATANSGYTFSGWSGDLSGSTSPSSVVMNGPRNVTANFTLSQSSGPLAVTPSEGLSASGGQGGPFSPSIQVYTLQNTGGSSINWTASKGQSWVTLSSTGGTLGAGASTTVTVSINSNASSLGVGSYSDTVNFTSTTNSSGNTSRLVALVVSTTTQTFTVTTNPSGLQITVDSLTYTAPQNFSWAAGSSHTLSVPSPQSGASGVRYVYASWSDGGAQSHSITAPSSGATYTANLTTQYSLITSVNPGGAGTVNPSGTTWYSSGHSVPVSATANSDYSFNGWSRDLSGSTNPSSIVMDGPKGITANFFSTKTNATSPNNISTPRAPRGPNKGPLAALISIPPVGLFQT